MLTVEQVKQHSEVSCGSDMPNDEDRGAYYKEYTRRYITGEDYDFTKSMARLLYIHNEHASKLRIICPLLEAVPSSKIPEQAEEDVKATIDWERFTKWINRHDDLTENNLVTRKVWSFCYSRYIKQGKIGRDGLLDTMKNKVVDCNKIVLV